MLGELAPQRRAVKTLTINEYWFRVGMASGASQFEVFDTPVLGELAPQRRTEDLNWQRRPWAGLGSLSTGSPAGRLKVTGTRKLL